MIVIPGPSSLGLGWRIAETLGLEPNPVEHRIFPDGESYIRLTKPVAGEKVVGFERARMAISGFLIKAGFLLSPG